MCKPLSAKAWFERLISILLNPGRNVRSDDYYGAVGRIPVFNETESSQHCLRQFKRTPIHLLRLLHLGRGGGLLRRRHGCASRGAGEVIDQ